MIRRLAPLVIVLIAAAAEAQQVWSVVVVGGKDNDPRVQSVREAVAFWNRKLTDLGVPVRFGPITRDDDAMSEGVLQRVSDGKLEGRAAYRALDMRDYHGDVVIFLSKDADLMSSGMPRLRGARGYVILRRADVPPLSLPNVARNVAAHELGHVLGLEHNEDPDFLMCGRPAPCRPSGFQLEEKRFFPLTEEEKQYLRRRYRR